MEIYFSPEIINPESQILNVVDQNQKAVGYLAIIFTEKKAYVYGHLEDEGVREDFKDLITPYLQGIAKSKTNLELYSYIATGGKN
ncbi:hypothetical protein [Tepidibacillus fermentans]|uniref:Acetyltransferase (GNAT) family protein n=1 Tax=Tepidibacillus fermentans TaxID=1281767 RepID=A0A4R3KJ86_9BACI|nr:hypothetical protein [Tepidibacillus fermentans]TCS83198.1 hypothetical protein EDD72_106127 [Tepidibacillus fermentans]